jgi:hypothetical protein
LLDFVDKVLVRPAAELQPVPDGEFELLQPEGVSFVPVAHLAAEVHLEEVRPRVRPGPRGRARSMIRVEVGVGVGAL